MSASDSLPYCRIWNANGLELYSEPFLPYDERPVALEELKISKTPTFPGPDRVGLEDGRMLFPRSRFDDLKRLFNRTSQK